MSAWFISLLTVGLVIILDRWNNIAVKKLLNWIPSILFAYIIPAAITHSIGVDYSASTIHDFSKTVLIPLAILSVMSSMSFKQLKSIGIKPIALFVSGSFWIATFPILFMLLLNAESSLGELFFQQEYWKGMPPIVGSWIGGSTSQLVLKEVVECSEELFLSILVLDNLLVNIWTIFMFQFIKRSDSLNSFFNISDAKTPESIHVETNRTFPRWTILIVLVSIVGISSLVPLSFVAKVILWSIIGLLLSHFIKGWDHEWVIKLGGLFIISVMAILGLKLQLSRVSVEPLFLLTLIFWLIGHFIFMILIAKKWNIHLAWVPIASMANVGGISTAPAVTAAYREEWMPHAIVLAILSMASGTFWGLITIYGIRFIIQ